MGVITGRGFDKADVIALLTLIRTNFLGVTAKLDADSGVSSTNYGSTQNFGLPDVNQLTLFGWRDEGVLLNYLKTIRAGYAGVLAKLDVDAGVADTNYAALNGIADVIDLVGLSGLSQAGVFEGSLVKWLANYITAWNATLTKLDSDGTVNDTNFNSLWSIPTTKVDTTGCLLNVG